jgi:hypothetical protein
MVVVVVMEVLANCEQILYVSQEADQGPQPNRHARPH